MHLGDLTIEKTNICFFETEFYILTAIELTVNNCNKLGMAPIDRLD